MLSPAAGLPVDSLGDKTFPTRSHSLSRLILFGRARVCVDTRLFCPDDNETESSQHALLTIFALKLIFSKVRHSMKFSVFKLHLTLQQVCNVPLDEATQFNKDTLKALLCEEKPVFALLCLFPTVNCSPCLLFTAFCSGDTPVVLHHVETSKGR